MYRAIQKSSYKGPDYKIHRQSSVRLPSNLPYVLDNILEFIRPECMPSRRHAIYSSPTPELALKNASSGRVDRSDYVVCKVIVDPASIRIAQLIVTDARYHPDIQLITRYINNISSHEMHSLVQRKEAALLFSPGTLPFEIEDILNNKIVSSIMKYASENSTFWSEATSIPVNSEGELFFELNAADSFYQLHEVPHP